jgi:LysR family hydrogen peroxide-inducible transcriptional activator
MLTLKQMYYFDALARTLHFGKAAESVSISQPALSAQIAEMEGRLKCRLVERRRGPVVLTEAGQRLLPKVRRILGEVRALEEQFQQERGILTGTLRVGMIPTVAPYVLPSLVPHLAAHFPKLNLQVREAVTETLALALVAGDLDAILAAHPIEETGLAHATLFRDRFFMAASVNDRDVLASPLNQHQVALDRLLLLEEGHCLRDQALAVCKGVQQKKLVSFGATSLPTLLQMVAHGMGQTLLPEIALHAEAYRNGELRIVPFAAPEPARDIALFWRKSSERAKDFEAFGDAVKTVASAFIGKTETAR